MIRYLDLAAQYKSLKPEIDAAIANVIADTAFVGGKYARDFEQKFADYIGVPHCVGVANGTDAIEIALACLDLPKDSEVIVPAYTFVATAEAVVRSGFTPVFCDVAPGHYTISLADLEKKISKKTSAIIAVHLYGHACDMDAILDLAKKHRLKVIEDTAQAHGALYKNRKVGTFGVAATFSFYPGKNLGAYGDAGAIVTDDADLAQKMRKHADHGRTEKYTHHFIGRNSRLDGIQAAILSVKLKHLESWNSRRREIAKIYDESLSGVSAVKTPRVAAWAQSVYHLYVICCERRDELRDYLTKQNIETGVHYPLSLPQQPAFAGYGQLKENLFANTLGAAVLSLPMGEHLSDGDAGVVLAAIKNFYKSSK